MRAPLFFLFVIFSGCRDGSRDFEEVLQYDTIVNEQIHSLKVRGLLGHLL